MGQIIRCPLIGVTCMKPITIEEKSFFLAEAEKPEDDSQWRREALTTVLEREYKYKIRSALDESDVNAFTCKICEMIQTCAYGIADISNNNPNVLLELGMMIALGKPAIILISFVSWLSPFRLWRLWFSFKVVWLPQPMPVATQFTPWCFGNTHSSDGSLVVCMLPFPICQQFSAHHIHLPRGINPNADLMPLHHEHGDINILTDLDGFTWFSG